MNGGVLDYLGEDKEHLVLFAKERLKEEPDINYFIFGHRHIVLQLPIAEQSDVVIIGDWITYFSYAVFDGERVSVYRWKE